MTVARGVEAERTMMMSGSKVLVDVADGIDLVVVVASLVAQSIVLLREEETVSVSVKARIAGAWASKANNLGSMIQVLYCDTVEEMREPGSAGVKMRLTPRNGALFILQVFNAVASFRRIDTR